MCASGPEARGLRAPILGLSIRTRHANQGHGELGLSSSIRLDSLAAFMHRSGAARGRDRGCAMIPGSDTDIFRALAVLVALTMMGIWRLLG